MPIIPWELSQDSFFPLPKDHDYALIYKYDKAWACVHALTYSVMVTEDKVPFDEEQEKAYQSILTGGKPPGGSPT